MSKNDGPCSVEGCERQAWAKGMCSTHYNQHRKSIAVKPPQQSSMKCSAEGCQNTARSKGLCPTHYTRQRKGIAVAEPEHPDVERLRQVVIDYLPLINSESRRLNRKRWEEIAQESVVSIMRSVTFDPEREVAGWVRSLVKGAYTHLGRHERRHIKADLPRYTKLEDLRADLPTQEWRIELAEAVTMIEGLPERQKRVAEYLLSGHEARDIAGLMGISYEGARQLVARMRENLLMIYERKGK